MLHNESHTLTGKTVHINSIAGPEYENQSFTIEDWTDIVWGGRAWVGMNGNPAAINYAIRVGRSLAIPIDMMR